MLFLRPRYWVQDFCSNISSSLLTRLVCSLGLMRLLCYGMTSHPCLSSLCPFLNVLAFVSCYPSLGLLVLIVPTLVSWASTGFSVSWPVGTLCMNVHTVRTAVGRSPRCTPFTRHTSMDFFFFFCFRTFLRVCLAFFFFSVALCWFLLLPSRWSGELQQ